MKKLFTTALLCMTVLLAAENVLSLYDFVAEDGSGIEKLLQLQEKRADKKEVYTNIDTTNDVCEQVELVTILLDQAVMKKVRELPADQGMIVLKSHLLWWKYFAAHPSLPDINGSTRGIFSLLTNFLRIKNRWEALKLPYKQYLIYAKIANLCQVRLNCGTYKMRFGEVCLKKEASWAHDKDAVKIYGKYFHDFPVSILPETCRQTAENHIAVISSGSRYYLCIWSDQGIPRAVHPLPGAKKIIAVSVTNKNRIETVYENGNKKRDTATFSLFDTNQIKIPTGKN